MKKFAYLMVAILLIIAVAAGCSPKESKKITERNADKVKKETAETVDNRTLLTVAKEDKFKNGCADCHKKTDDKDYRLSTEVKQMKGHPTVKEDATIKDCMDCHSKSPENRERLSNGLHNIHASSKVFRPKYDGECVSCHGMKSNGEVFIKSPDGPAPDESSKE